MKKILLLAVLITGCCLTASAQMGVDGIIKARAIATAKKQLAAEEAAKQEDMVLVFIENGALTKVVRDGEVKYFSVRSRSPLSIPEWRPPYYHPVLYQSFEKEWMDRVTKFAKLQQQLEEEKFELFNVVPSSKDEVLLVYRRRISVDKKKSR